MPNAKREIGHDRNTVVGRRSGMTEAKIQRRYPIGAELIGEGLTHFRVWAPKAKRVDVILEGQWGEDRGTEAAPTFQKLAEEPGGYFSGSAGVATGVLYRFR